MKAVSKCVFLTLISLPALASASYETLSFSCSSTLVVSQVNGYQASCDGDFSFDSGTLLNETLISITANGLLNIGKQSILTAPDIRLIANTVTIQGRLNALGGSIEMNAENSAQMTSTAIVHLRNKVLHRPENMNNRWDVELADLLHVVKVDLLPKVITTDDFGTLASGSLVLGSSGIRLQNLQAMQQGGQLILTRPITTYSDITLQETLSAISSNNFSVSQVPEPTHLSMLALGLFGIGLLTRRKANKL